MAVLPVVNVKNPILRTHAKTIPNYDKRIQKLFVDLDNTLKAQKDPVGVGLAAPQIGKSLRGFLVKSGKTALPFINPEIISLSEDTNDPTKKREDEYIMEGCLSLPHYYGPVKRAESVTIRYQKPVKENDQWKLQAVEETHKGLAAQIIQHEVDHLNGVLFIDRLIEQKRKLYKLEKNKWVEVELP